MIPKNGGLTVPDKRKFAGLYRMSRIGVPVSPSIQSSQSAAAIGGVRNAGLYNRVRRFSSYVLTATIPSIIAACAQLRQARNNISEAYRPFSSVSHLRADQYKPAIHLGFRFFQPAILGHGLASDCQQELFRLQRLLLSILISERDGDALGVLLDRFHFAASVDLNNFSCGNSYSKLRGNLSSSPAPPAATLPGCVPRYQTSYRWKQTPRLPHQLPRQSEFLVWMEVPVSSDWSK